jgi:hypothetical protein
MMRSQKISRIDIETISRMYDKLPTNPPVEKRDSTVSSIGVLSQEIAPPGLDAGCCDSIRTRAALPVSP